MSGRQPITYLTAGEIIAFTRAVLERGGQAHVRERALLDGAVQRPQNAAYYEGADILTQAALYMVGIASNHPFIDGNKRTKYIAGLTFLRVNGALDVSASLDDDQIAIWLERVVTHKLSFEMFVESLRRRLAMHLTPETPETPGD